MKDEDIIRKMTEGAKNPFVVPEGYFDGFTARLMATRLPAAQRRPRRILPRIWRYAAALFVVLGAGTVLLFSSRSNRLAENDGAEQYQEEYINDALDYALVSNSNIELYLTEAY